MFHEVLFSRLLTYNAFAASVLHCELIGIDALAVELGVFQRSHHAMLVALAHVEAPAPAADAAPLK